MNPYEQKQEARRDRLERAADRHEAKSEAAFRGVRRIADGIPLGQPILVGHHSERHARRDCERIDNGMRRGIEEQKIAQDLRARAAAVGTGGVSSDDPDGASKLEEKLHELQATRDARKRFNKAWRAAGSPKPFPPDGVAIEDHAKRWREIAAAANFPAEDLPGVLRGMQVCSWHEAPFPPYSFTNIGARIRDTAKRIENLRQRAAVRVALEAEAAETGDESTGRKTWARGQAGGLSFAIVDDVIDNRTRIEFCGKPLACVRAELKRYGFRWSPERGAWVRLLGHGAVVAACLALGLNPSQVLAPAPAPAKEPGPELEPSPDSPKDSPKDSPEDSRQD